ncbi:hypothetical protein [Sphingobium sp. CFD-1]|jgi:hypothetical protein|uniref:hypothetical protein n=1 Tax=Sphingobium sp. CFD-1 TaxID=2878545 RepID=UPI00214AA7DC|nr:hypothetical protein [Sphingobium sp. CFD-1]
MAAKQSALGLLHEALAEMFLEDIRICKEEGIPMSSSDKGVIVKFLKDNNITADIDNEHMQSLKDEFQDELAQRRAARAAELLKETAEDADGLAGVL